MFRFLHLADLHLGWTPRYLDSKKGPERRARRDGLLERGVDFALEQEIPLVVIAGDLFETHKPDARLVQEVVGQLRRLTDAGVEVVTTPGNHDEITYTDSVYREKRDEWPGLLVMNPTAEHVGTLHIGSESVFVYSLAYTGGVTPVSRPLNEFPRLGEPGFHLAVFHGTIGSGDARSLPLDRSALEAAGYDYVALGHIHLPSVTKLGRTPVVYCGCLEGKGFDDPGVPYWTVVAVDGGRAEVTQVPSDVQRIHVEEVDLTECETLDDVTARIEALQDADAIVRVRLTGSLHFPLEPEELAARYRSAFYHFDIRDESDSVSDELLDRWAAERTIRGMFVKRMQAALEGAGTDEEKRKVVRAIRYGVRALRGAA